MGHFYFVRHGQTIWNVENKICGATDIALTEFGHQQAIETGRKILAEGIKAADQSGGYCQTYFRDHRNTGKSRAASDRTAFWKVGSYRKKRRSI